MSVDYTKVAIFDYVLSGIGEAYSTLLDISGYVVPATIYDFVAGAMDCVVLWLLLEYHKDADLFLVAVTMLASTTFFLILFTAIAVLRGWLDPFMDGMIRSNSFKVCFTLKSFHFWQVSLRHVGFTSLHFSQYAQNKGAVKNIFQTAAPLALGSLREYGEVGTHLFLLFSQKLVNQSDLFSFFVGTNNSGRL
jgi:hypothetical protein